MPDREKVMLALEHHKETAVCNGCPYAEDDDTSEGYCPIYDDTIALLREQEPQEPHYCEADDSWGCGNCGETVGYGEYNPLGPVRNKYCKECGKRVKWI